MPSSHDSARPAVDANPVPDAGGATTDALAPDVPTPDVSVVIATRDRPQLLREAVQAVIAQTHPGVVETIAVFDQSEPDLTLESADPLRPVRVITNTREPGLPGSRNSGVDAARAAVVAFCDDDDAWRPTKLARQLEVLEAQPEVDVVTTGIAISIDGEVIDRLPDRDQITFEDLLRDRVMEAHPSSVMVRREAFLDRIGYVDEHIPGGYAEDYEWILRAARLHPVAVVREPLVVVLWHAKSFYLARWRMIADGLSYLLERFPEFADEPVGLGRIQGQRAFAKAAAGDRSEAWPLVRLTLKNDWRQPRAYLAAAVAAGVLPADRVVRELNRRGRGI